MVVPAGFLSTTIRLGSLRSLAKNRHLIALADLETVEVEECWPLGIDLTGNRSPVGKGSGLDGGRVTTSCVELCGGIGLFPVDDNLPGFTEKPDR